MKYLITGGAGFIGSYLCEALVAGGDHVTVIDNLSTGKLENIASLLPQKDKFTFIEADLLTMPDAELDKLAAECDRVCHLAAAVGVELVVSSPVRTIQTNVRATEKLLEACARYDRRIVTASTSEVYGKSENEAFAETDDLLIGTPYHSRWGYACSKLLDEFYLMAYYRECGLPGTIVRFFNTVGPRQSGRYGMVIPRMTRMALEGKDVTVYGDGTQSRCFCHVKDTVRAVLGIFDSPAAVGKVYNIGSTELVSIRELAERIIKRSGSSSEIVYIPYEQAYQPGFEDMHRRKPDTSAIKALTGWQPEYCLDSIIDDVVAFIGSKKDGNNA